MTLSEDMKCNTDNEISHGVHSIVI